MYVLEFLLLKESINVLTLLALTEGENIPA